MREPLLIAYAAMPEPRRVVALGDCALGCDLLGTSDEIVGPVDAVLPVDLRIPGCPPTPEAILQALLSLIDGTARDARDRSTLVTTHALAEAEHAKRVEVIVFSTRSTFVAHSWPKRPNYGRFNHALKRLAGVAPGRCPGTGPLTGVHLL